MSSKSQRDAAPKLRLDQITTVWSLLTDPAKFIMRYAPAIQRYFQAMIPNRHDAEEAIQDFLVRVMQNGFVNADSQRGRFRDYLRTAVRHAALAQWRRRTSERGRGRGRDGYGGPGMGAEGGEASPAAATVASTASAAMEGQDAMEREWVEEWRRCVLDRAWRALERYETRSSATGRGMLPHTTLRLVIEHPDEDSKALAARAASLTGQAMSADTFRQRLSRARRVFARLLVQEVAETLQRPTPGAVEDELIDLGLMPYVAQYLPPDWRTTGVLPDLV
jgi:DNA-directed RNA polymerase specialized sigma24 family protein